MSVPTKVPSIEYMRLSFVVSYNVISFIEVEGLGFPKTKETVPSSLFVILVSVLFKNFLPCVSSLYHSAAGLEVSVKLLFIIGVSPSLLI